MINIYKYYHNTKEWKELINSNLKGKERHKAINDFIKNNGDEVSIKEYFSDNERYSLNKDYSYECFGEPTNSIEKLAYGEIVNFSDLSYCNAKKRCPEDLVESRTSWDEMKEYADGLYYFIDSLKNEIARGELVFLETNE